MFNELGFIEQALGAVEIEVSVEYLPSNPVIEAAASEEIPYGQGCKCISLRQHLHCYCLSKTQKDRSEPQPHHDLLL